MGRVPVRRGLRAVAALAAALTLSAGTSGCGLDRAADRAADSARQAAQDRVDDAVDGAVDQAEGQVREQAQQALDRALDEVAGETDATCGSYSSQPADQRSAQAGALLAAFWLADLTTQAPPAEVASAFAGDIDDRCAAAPDAAVADVVRESYASGAFSPPQG